MPRLFPNSCIALGISPLSVPSSMEEGKRSCASEKCFAIYKRVFFCIAKLSIYPAPTPCQSQCKNDSYHKWILLWPAMSLYQKDISLLGKKTTSHVLTRGFLTKFKKSSLSPMQLHLEDSKRERVLMSGRYFYRTSLLSEVMFRVWNSPERQNN